MSTLLLRSRYLVSLHRLNGFCHKSLVHTTAKLAGPSQDAIKLPEEIKVPSNVTFFDGYKVPPEVINISETATQVTGAVLPWVDLNFMQKLLFPYTYPLMNMLDYMTTLMPWWAAIATTNVIIRLAFIPLTIKQTSISVRANNYLPETQMFQTKLREALQAGDSHEAALVRTKMKDFFVEKDIKIWDRLWPIMVQTPAFFTMFFLLKKLSYLPTPGMLTGGALWFSNLTLPDPYYVLPFLTCLSNLLLFEYGMITKPANMTPVMRWGLRGFAVVLFPILYSFPSSIVIFWASSNFLTLGTNLILKLPKVRKALKIPPSIEHNLDTLPLANQTFKGQMKSALDSGRASKTSHDIRRLDDIAFRKAGVGPLRKTYKELPNQAKAKS